MERSRKYLGELAKRIDKLPGRPDAGRGDRGALLRGADERADARLGHGDGRRVPLRRAEGVVQPAERRLRPRDHARGSRRASSSTGSPSSSGTSTRATTWSCPSELTDDAEESADVWARLRRHADRSDRALRALGPAQDGRRRRPRQPVPEAGGGRARVVPAGRAAQGGRRRARRGRSRCCPSSSSGSCSPPGSTWTGPSAASGGRGSSRSSRSSPRSSASSCTSSRGPRTGRRSPAPAAGAR